jgi:hypothetical protein
MSAFDI